MSDEPNPCDHCGAPDGDACHHYRNPSCGPAGTARDHIVGRTRSGAAVRGLAALVATIRSDADELAKRDGY